jgi:hypothetical protein
LEKFIAHLGRSASCIAEASSLVAFHTINQPEESAEDAATPKDRARPKKNRYYTMIYVVAKVVVNLLVKP